MCSSVDDCTGAHIHYTYNTPYTCITYNIMALYNILCDEIKKISNKTSFFHRCFVATFNLNFTIFCFFDYFHKASSEAIIILILLFLLFMVCFVVFFFCFQYSLAKKVKMMKWWWLIKKKIKFLMVVFSFRFGLQSVTVFRRLFFTSLHFIHAIAACK